MENNSVYILIYFDVNLAFFGLEAILIQYYKYYLIINQCIL
ncbi:hypothetical protein H1P_410014 [Hyella patelloides LEGE 07179]|uniref:Uncharacterized protein n=1 Tax=Hyella patelloides LEGE 07179 TaxID=945734 RepID=A0A563VXG6_9CYAN|nr:hypothetical protein H1P_410014 [Hyella patelloides LEGE 07179]